MRFSRTLIFLCTFVFGLKVQNDQLGQTLLQTTNLGRANIRTVYSKNGKIVQTLSNMENADFEAVAIDSLFNALTVGGDCILFDNQTIEGPFYVKYLDAGDIKATDQPIMYLGPITRKEHLENLIANLVELGQNDEVIKRLMTLYWICSCLYFQGDAYQEIKDIIQNKLDQDAQLKAAFGLVKKTHNQDFDLGGLNFSNNSQIIELLDKADWVNHKYAVLYCILLGVNPASLPRLRKAFRLDALSDEDFKKGYEAVVKWHLDNALDPTEENLLSEFDLEFAKSRRLDFGQTLRAMFISPIYNLFGYPIWYLKVNGFPWKTLFKTVLCLVGCVFITTITWLGFNLSIAICSLFTSTSILMLVVSASLGLIITFGSLIISITLVLLSIETVFPFDSLRSWSLPNVNA